MKGRTNPIPWSLAVLLGLLGADAPGPIQQQEKYLA